MFRGLLIHWSIECILNWNSGAGDESRFTRSDLVPFVIRIIINRSTPWTSVISNITLCLTTTEYIQSFTWSWLTVLKLSWRQEWGRPRFYLSFPPPYSPIPYPQIIRNADLYEGWNWINNQPGCRWLSVSYADKPTVPCCSEVRGVDHECSLL